MNLLRLVNTIRHLRLEQIVGQIRHRLRTRLENPEQLLSRRVPEYPGCRWEPSERFLASGAQSNTREVILAGFLSFINSQQQIGRGRSEECAWIPDWNRDDLPKLWLYNLHYFEWIWALKYDEARLVVTDWIEQHPLGKGRVGWEPYPISLRLINWCAYFFDQDSSPGSNRGLAPFRQFEKAACPRFDHSSVFLQKLWQSVWRQAEWLMGHLEYHLLGNHLLENAAALCFAGSCFAGTDAERWLKRGLEILREQTKEQVLPDGLHFELSPMYHSRICYLFLILLNTGNEQIAAIVRPVIRPVLKALQHLTHPDGQIALLNDSAFGIYNPPSELLEYGERLGLTVEAKESGPWALPDAGYYGFRSNAGDYIVCDAGKIGPDYIPGHAHADVFSFELSLNGQRVIVDSGVHDYERSQLREYCRSTRAHNTVEIEGQDQAEMWGAFKVGHRPRVKGIGWNPCADGFQLRAWHDGYRNLAGHPRVHREFLWQDKRFSILDRILSTEPFSAVGRLHLHPSCMVHQIGSKSVVVNFSLGKFNVLLTTDSEFCLRESFYCPQFGMKQRNACIEYTIPSDGSYCRIDFEF